MTEQNCKWPAGTCACYVAKQQAPDPGGRVWMHCEEGLSMTKASMARFFVHCLKSRIEIGQIHPFNPRYDRCQVSASVRLKPEQFEEFEHVTGGKLSKPPRVSVNSSCPGDLPKDSQKSVVAKKS